MAKVIGQELYEALKPIMEDLGIDGDTTKAISFNFEVKDAATYTVESFVTGEQAERLSRTVRPRRPISPQELAEVIDG